MKCLVFYPQPTFSKEYNWGSCPARPSCLAAREARELALLGALGDNWVKPRLAVRGRDYLQKVSPLWIEIPSWDDHHEGTDSHATGLERHGK